MERRQEVGLSHTENAHWHIETLKGPQHRLEAQRRLDYLTLMPKLALCCLVLDWLYLGYRMVLVANAPKAKLHFDNEPEPQFYTSLLLLLMRL